MTSISKGNVIQVSTTFHLNQTFHPPLSSWTIPLSSWTPYCHPERSEGSPHAVWSVVSGRKGGKKCPVTTWNHSISILSCCVRAENSIKRPGHNMEKWKSRWHTAIVTLFTDSSLRSEWQDEDCNPGFWRDHQRHARVRDCVRNCKGGTHLNAPHSAHHRMPYPLQLSEHTRTRPCKDSHTRRNLRHSLFLF